MINVTTKENVLNEKGGYETRLSIKGHKDGEKASVFNGVLTIFSSAAGSKDDFGNAIAGYEPSSWHSWSKASE